MSESINRKNNREGGRFCRGDIFLVAFFLILALGCFAWFAVSREDGRTLQIFYDGQMITEVPLSQARTQKTEEDSGKTRYCLILYPEGGVSCEWYESCPDLASTVPGGSGYNLVAVSGNYVRMESADCRDQICVHHRPITGGGESIICLPHKLVAEIVGGADPDTPDGMAKAEGAGESVWEEGRRGHETDG